MTLVNLVAIWFPWILMVACPQIFHYILITQTLLTPKQCVRTMRKDKDIENFQTVRAKPSSPAGGNRGRPPRDLIAVADQWLEKLKKAEESDSGLFRDGRKESMGFVKRLKNDLKLAENNAKEGVAFEAFSNRRRRIEAALNLLQCANQRGRS